MGKIFILQHDRPECIGCGACAVIAPEFWEMDDDEEKSDIIKGENKPDGSQELKIQEKDYELNLEAAESCPVECIHIIDDETKEKII